MSELPTIRASLVAAAAAGAPRPARAALGRRGRSGRRAGRAGRGARAARRPRAVIGLALATGLAATSVLVATATTGPTTGSTTTTGTRTGATSPATAALAAAVGHGSVAGADVWRAARTIAATTPRPPGATVSIAWVGPLAATGRPVARLTVAATVERRAMCQWYRYWLATGADGRRAASAVIEQIPGWPGMSEGPSRRSAVLVAAAVRANQPGPVRAGVASC